MEKRRALPMLVVLFASSFLAAFNENSVNVALVDIMGTYQVDATTAQWLATGYMIVCAVVTTVSAFLMKRIRLRTLFFAAAVFLVIGSVAAMAATSFPTLLAARLFQGVGSGIFIPMCMSTVLVVAPRDKLGTYLSIGSSMTTLGPAFAPVITGVLDTAFGWRFVFLPAALIVAVLAVAGAFLIKNLSEPQKARLDVPSVALSALGLTMFVMGISQVFSNLAFGLLVLALGLAVIAVFCVRQTRLDDPLLDLAPMRDPLFSMACALVIVCMMMLFSMSVLLPLYYEAALGMTARDAGLLLVVPILFNAALAVVGGRTLDAHGTWPLLPLGYACMSAGLLTCCLSAQAQSTPLVFVGSALGYAAVGAVFSPSQTAALSVLPREQNESGVAIVNTFVQVAASIGPSLFIGVMTMGATAAASAGAADVAQQALGFADAMAVAAAIAAAAAVLSAVYSKRRQKALAKTSKGPAAVETAEEPTVRQMMQEPYTVPTSATVKQVMQELVARRTSGLPVVDGSGKMQGFITDGDIMAALGRKAPTGQDLVYGLHFYANDDDFKKQLDDVSKLNVMELATSDVVAVDADASLKHACEVLSKRRIKKLPVVEDGVLVGTLSRSTVVRRLMDSYVSQ